MVAVALVTALEVLPALRHVRADPAALLVAYLAFRSDVLGGALTVLLLGILLDGVSGAPWGLHALSLQVLFLGVRVTAHGLQLEPSPRVWPLAVAASAAHHGVVAAMVLGLGVLDPRGWLAFLPSLAANAVLAWPLLAVASVAARRYSPEPDNIFLKT
jgi:rod shape-determining protein MreD